jgi:DNA-binding HxlR family transcriptional regulator
VTDSPANPAGRSYGQACPLACALDLLGERWTLLVVRELLLGPKRFGELGTRLPGAGPNRLSTRLKRLHAAGVTERTADGAHALTAYGEGLRAPVLGLGSWGLSLLPAFDVGSGRADLVALVMSGVVDPAKLTGIDVSLELHAEEVFTMTVHDGAVAVRSGPADDPSPVRLHCEPGTFVALLLGGADLEDSIRSGDVSLQGTSPSLAQLFAAFAATTREHLSAPSSADPT